MAQAKGVLKTAGTALRIVSKVLLIVPAAAAATLFWMKVWRAVHRPRKSGSETDEFSRSPTVNRNTPLLAASIGRGEPRENQETVKCGKTGPRG
jgi:hypothetical protein